MPIIIRFRLDFYRKRRKSVEALCLSASLTSSQLRVSPFLRDHSNEVELLISRVNGSRPG